MAQAAINASLWSATAYTSCTQEQHTAGAPSSRLLSAVSTPLDMREGYHHYAQLPMSCLRASLSLSLSAYDVFKIDIQTSAAVCVAVKPLQFKEKCLPFIANGVVIRIRSNWGKYQNSRVSLHSTDNGCAIFNNFRRSNNVVWLINTQVYYL